MVSSIQNLKKEILEVSYLSQEGHIASSFSVLDILYVLYNRVLKEQDQFVLSKGHASLGYYAVLKEKGLISQDEFYNFCKFDAKLGGHPKRNEDMGIIASTGSLGHGLPISVGLALSNKIQDKNGNVYCLLGDQECNEGTTYESIMSAVENSLNNLYIIIDNNNSDTRSINLSSKLPIIFNAFGCDVENICGHNHYDIYNSLIKKTSKPKVIVCNTIKGCGCKTIEENSFEWHHKSPKSKDELEKLISEVYNEKTIY
jgi:transketolase